MKNAQMQGVQGTGGLPRPGSEMPIELDKLSGKRVDV
jgi:hypothetical protein